MPMSQQHKDALARGRKEARAIKTYLEALKARKPGRPVTADSLKKRLKALNEKLNGSDDPLESVELIQKRIDLENELKRIDEVAHFDELEEGFVEHAAGYSERKSITYTAWRELGVPASTLRAAGIPETRRR